MTDEEFAKVKHSILVVVDFLKRQPEGERDEIMNLLLTKFTKQSDRELMRGIFVDLLSLN